MVGVSVVVALMKEFESPWVLQVKQELLDLESATYSHEQVTSQIVSSCAAAISFDSYGP
jgi:hypothetical protein